MPIPVLTVHASLPPSGKLGCGGKDASFSEGGSGSDGAKDLASSVGVSRCSGSSGNGLSELIEDIFLSVVE